MSDSATTPTHPKIGIAITTVGRWDELRHLFEDLAAQSQPPYTVAVAHHNADDAACLDALVQSFGDTLPITTVLSARGISNGRNAAIATFPDDVEWICFPNDTSRVGPDFLERMAAHAMPHTTVCAAKLVDREGVRNNLPAAGTPTTRRTIWGAIEPATMVRRRDFDSVGGFDPEIGSGADTPWQAGEGTDLLLRMSTLDDFSIEWVHDVAVRAQTEFAHLTPEERRRKIRNYGRGTGFVYRRWDYPAWDLFRHVFGAVLSPLLKRSKFELRDGLALALGRAEGVAGKVISRNRDNRAIVR